MTLAEKVCCPRLMRVTHLRCAGGACQHTGEASGCACRLRVTAANVLPAVWASSSGICRRSFSGRLACSHLGFCQVEAGPFGSQQPACANCSRGLLLVCASLLASDKQCFLQKLRLRLCCALTSKAGAWASFWPCTAKQTRAHGRSAAVRRTCMGTWMTRSTRTSSVASATCACGLVRQACC